MSERFDLQKMLLEIQDDETINTQKAAHLSQSQIREMLTRRKKEEVKQDPKPADVP